MTRKTSALPFTKPGFSLSAIALLITGAVLYAGPLNPPTGPVAPTFKTLSEVEPRIAINATNTPGDADSLFKITQPGSYYLTGNITGVVGKHGIEIVASGVTLDLNGFDLAGVPAMGSFDGVSVTADSLTNVAVLNGSIRNWGDEGVDLASLARVEGVLASGNAGTGISTSSGSTVSNCSASFNTGAGISTGIGCTITNCSASDNNGIGISAFIGSTVSNCSASFTVGTGISTGIGCTINNCSASYNTGIGITTSSGCTISNCTVYENDSSGINTGIDCTVSTCSVYQNTGTGIRVTDGCTVIDCSAYQNSVNGITAGDGCTVSACNVSNNVARGINANNGCQITGCLTRNNQSDGISFNFSCTVSGNTCNGDGAAAGNHGGIRVLGQANRIEGNNVTYADRGLLVESGGNIIVRNTVKGCTLNWSIVAGNAYGAVVATPAGAAVNGNAAAASLGSTDPNANFSY